MPIPAPILSQFQQAMARQNYPAARTIAERMVILHPNDPVAYDMLVGVLLRTGQEAAALPHAKRITELAPHYAGGWVSLGVSLAAGNDHSAAADAFARAVDLEPGNLAHWADHVTALINTPRLRDAELRCREALTHFPDQAPFILRLASILSEQGRPKETADLLARALDLHPDNVHMAAMLCTNGNYAGVDRLTSLRRHQHCGRIIMQQDLTPAHRYTPPTPAPAPAPLRAPGHGHQGRLRIGFLSADFRTCAVAFFIEPLLKHLDRSRFELFCYASDPRRDATTERLMAAIDPAHTPHTSTTTPKSWRTVHALSGPAIAKAITVDQIDILIELHGYTAGFRFDALRLKPAPIIATYCGYPNTTGLPTMDYRLIDAITDPPGSLADESSSEKLIRIDPCFLCYQPPAIPVPDRGSISRPVNPAAITFGSFNNITKVGDDTLRLWARVLERVPGTRLVIKSLALSEEPIRQMHIDRFIAAGIPVDRLELLPGAPGLAEHLATYHCLDIALDTYPYAGTTTTCEAMHMGIPVVTLARAWDQGGMHAERVGASLLTTVGTPELIAGSLDQYVDIAAALAADVQRLTHLHTTLRARLASSPLCDAPRFAAGFGNALCTMWNSWVKS